MGQPEGVPGAGRVFESAGFESLFVLGDGILVPSAGSVGIAQLDADLRQVGVAGQQGQIFFDGTLQIAVLLELHRAPQGLLRLALRRQQETRKSHDCRDMEHRDTLDQLLGYTILSG